MDHIDHGFDAQAETDSGEGSGLTTQRLRAIASNHWKALGAAFIVGGAIGYGASFAFKPTYLSSTLFIPPQQQQGAAASALASLSALSGLVGGAGGKSSVEQYISMLQGVSVSDRVVKRFGLDKEYDTQFAEDARKRLAKRVTIVAGKKDGLITVQAEDEDPARAAAIANQYVEELRALTSRLAVTEAQQRRVFFERMLNETKQKLVNSQVALEASGFSSGALKTEPHAAADTYARLRAELTAAQVKLQVARGSYADASPQVVQQSDTVRALEDQVARLEATESAQGSSPDYIGKYREFKYQETLFDLFAKQYELARVDESREGALVQVVDEAQPAERKHFPSRKLFAAVGALAAALALGARFWRRLASQDLPPSAG